jgi:hypothetical protein
VLEVEQLGRDRRADGVRIVAQDGGVEHQQTQPVGRDQLAKQRVVRAPSRLAHHDEPGGARRSAAILA